MTYETQNEQQANNGDDELEPKTLTARNHQTSSSSSLPAKQRGPKHQSCASDVCFSLSNIALIVACLVALLFLAKFITDEPLYEYGEYILSLTFYRQLIYIIIAVCLTLLVPIFNSLGACLPAKRRQRRIANWGLISKVLYAGLMVVLLFIGLVFVISYVRHEGVAKQIDVEMIKHMELRYVNTFSYIFLDRIQEKYQCCDTLWYRVHFNNKLPLSCYRGTNHLDSNFTKTCSDVLATIVSNRCIVISLALLIAIIALIGLIAIDLMDLTGREYYVAEYESYLEREQKPLQHQNFGSKLGRSSPSQSDTSSWQDLRPFELDNQDQDPELRSRLEQHERVREGAPLLRETAAKSSAKILSSKQNIPNSAQMAEDDEPYPEVEADLPAYLEPGSSALTGAASPTNSMKRITKTIVTTRTSYIANQRTQSPIFVGFDSSREQQISPGNSNQGRLSPSANSDGRQSGSLRSQAQSPARGVLKKSGSRSSRLDNDPELEQQDSQQDPDDLPANFLASDSADLEEHQRRLNRELQTRRSLLNVRFAD